MTDQDENTVSSTIDENSGSRNNPYNELILYEVDSNNELIPNQNFEPEGQPPNDENAVSSTTSNNPNQRDTTHEHEE